MIDFNPQPEIPARTLATDLDGTLIPLPGNAHNKKALAEIFRDHESGKLNLIYATGRHFESVLEAIDQYTLPTPDWIVCDVGSAIFRQVDNAYQRFTPYEDHLHETTGSVNRDKVESTLSEIDGLDLQAPDHQQRFKVSYQCTSETVNKLLSQIETRLNDADLPYDCMGSVDPFENCGLIDVLPRNVSKAYALLWLATHADFKPDEVIYSGDSGNDYAALVSGFRAIIVANSSEGLVDKVQMTLKSKNLEDRLYVANNEATSGVLEGCRAFGLID
ncbi:MAG: HAD-IIB family hydrolase [Opitutaceae bacterium]